MSEFKWVLLAIAILIIYLLLGSSSEAQGGAWVHGIVQDDAYQPVSGGRVWLERQWGNDWPTAPCCDNKRMQGHSFQFYPTQAGTYRVMYEKDGYEVDWIRYDEFTLPDGAPFGDIQIHVKRAEVAPTMTPTLTPPPVPTTLMPPTVDPTRTATPTATPNAAVSYITLAPAVEDTLEGHVITALGNYVPATCFEIAARERACPMSVTQPWVAMVPVNDEVECYRFQPFSCPRRAGVLIAARCQSPCDVAIIEGGEW